MVENNEKEAQRRQGKFAWVSIRNKENCEYRSRKFGEKEQLEWIKRQIQYIVFSDNFKLRYDLRAGEIYEFDFGINVNSEFSSRHYGVVIADSNPFNPLVMVCPLKTNHSGAHPKSDVDLGYIPELNTDHNTVAVVNQIRTIDKVRLYTKRAIGNSLFGQSNQTQDLTQEEEIIKLDNSKLRKIKDAYFNMIENGDPND